MKLLIPAAALLGIVMLSSCSSTYRTGQTPDDVYFSPGRASDLVRHHTDDDDYAYTDPDDNYLRQKVQNRGRWSTIDDADYWYSYNRPYANLYGYGYSPYGSSYLGNGFSIGLGNTYGFGNSYGFGNYYGFNNFGGYPFWNTFGYGNAGYYGYSPYSYGGYYGHGGYGGYYPGTVIVGQGIRSNTGPKPYMGGYTNSSFNNGNNGSEGRNNSRLGSFMRNTFSNSNNSSSNPHPSGGFNNSGQPSRSFTPSSTPSYSPSSSRGSVGGSSGGGSTSRPGRG